MEKDMKYYVRISNQVMLENRKNRKELTKELLEHYVQSGEKDICIIASGSSLNAALTALDFLNKYSGSKVSVLSPTEYMNYKKDCIKDKFIILISQSGCSTNIIEAIKSVKQEKKKAVLLTGNTEGDAKKYADVQIEYGVGNETIDYVTLGFVTLVEYLILFGTELGLQKGKITEETYDRIISDIEKCCRANEAMYMQAEEFVKQYEDSLLGMEKAMIIADGANMGAAREAALKFGETLKIPTIYYESEEFVHGPNMQLTPDYFVFFLDTNPYSDRMYEVYQATGLITEHTYLITDKSKSRDNRILQASEQVIHELTPLFTIVLFQYISAKVTGKKNQFKCHPLFQKFEERIHCKTSDYEEVMKAKIEKSREEKQDA